MDPEAALREAKLALRRKDYEEAAEALSNYWDWRKSGGFEPKNGDRRAEALGAKLSDEWGDGDSGWGEAGGYVHEGWDENPKSNPATTAAKRRCMR